LSRIHRLPEDLVNKIAAGEVVERPGAVVKELIENAIDAGATLVQVEIEGGGKTLIRVRDDGQGMGRADAELALERHATSKLASLEDLQAVSTHGFRGEALPSIASVSHLTLRTREATADEGTEIEVRHGRLVQVRATGHPKGTTVEVRDLFGAVPARRKFLRAEPTEAAHVAESESLLALARPGLGFFLKSGGRALIEAPAVSGLRPRIYQLFGGSVLDSLTEVEGGLEWARVSGFVSRPDGQRPARPMLRLFVNHRPVRDRALAKAVTEAYRGAGAGERGFEAFVFLDVPSHVVDVNVHPAKTEVRFADPRTAWTAVERSVREALSAGVRRAPRAETGRVDEAQARLLEATGRPAGPRPKVHGAWATGGESGAGLAREADEAPANLSSFEPRVIGQHRNTYIVATDGLDLILVDQHTAHERVRFEGLQATLDRRQPESQLLLCPLVAPLPPELWPIVEAHAETLAALGYEIEPFGGGSARIRAVPPVLAAREAGATLVRLLQDFREREGSDWLISGPRDRLAATLACHSSVRAGEPLNHETMSAIVRELMRAAHPTLCPHGRPTMVRIPREDVSRWFGRSGWRRQ
jgi:DNA mismatch repair protein MutL